MTNPHAPHRLWNDNPELATAIRDKVAEVRERGDGNYNLGGLPLGDEGISFLAHFLTPVTDIRILSLSTVGITDKAMPDIVSIAHHSPALSTLYMQNNAITGEGLRVLADGLKNQPALLNFDIRSNPLGESAGEALAEIAALPPLRKITAMDCNLGDAGIRPIAAVIAKSHTLEKVELGGNGVSLDGCRDYIKGLRQNRSLTSSGFLQGDDPTVNTYLTKSYAQVRNPNLLDTFPVDQHIRPKLQQNKADVKGLPPHLAGELRDIPHVTLKFIDARANAIFSLPGEFLIPASRETRRETYIRYETFMRGLPKLPAKGESFVAELFKEDANGFTALDNPRVNRSGNALLDTLQEQHVELTQDLLTQTTRRGSSILEAAAAASEPERLVSTLNAKGIKLGVGELLASNGLPTETYHNIIEQDGGAALFTVDNWAGKSRTELMHVYKTLPKEQQQQVGLHTLLQQLRPASQQGIGR